MSNILNLKGVKLLAITVLAVAMLATFGMVSVQTAGAADCSITTTLRVGSKGEQVRCLQMAVGVTADGSFGPMTKKAVMAWQKSVGLTADGIFGKMSRAALSGGSTGGTTGGTLPAGCTSTSGYSSTTGVKCDSSGTGPVVTNGMVSVSLASDNPAAGTLVAGSAAADLAKFTFSNGTSTELKVSQVKLQRTGYSADVDLSNVYLYNGVNRLTDSASVSTGVITFNDTAGLFKVPANSSVTITVKADIASTLAGTVGVTLTSYTAVGGTAVVVNLVGNQHSGVSVTGTATLDFNTTTTPSASTVDPQTDYTMWQNVVTVGNRDLWLKTFRLRQIGSVNPSDLQNFRLYVDGVAAGAAVPMLDSMGYVTFDFSANPVKMLTGARTVKMLGDIVGGSSRTFSFSLRTASDAVATDSQIGVNVLATANSSTFSARTSTSATINAGSLTFTKRTDSPSGNVVDSAPGAVLARFDVKAYGEAMKVENLSFRIDEDDADTTYTLRNGAIYLDGAQIGSTAAIAGDTDATQAYTNYTFGSSFVVTPGVTRVLEIRADIYNSDGTEDTSANDTIQLEIVTGSSNVQRVTSLTYGSYPAAATEANTLTVGTGSLTVAKDTSYGNQTTTVPKTNYLLGKYYIQANTTEGANITSIVIDFDEDADAFLAASDLTNLWLKIGGSTTGNGGIKSTVTATANTFSTNVNINAGQTISVEVYGDVASTATDGAGAADTTETSATVSYTTTGGSSTSTSAAEVDGQTITFSTGSFTSSLDGSSPLNRIAAGNQEVTAGVFKFLAANETYTIKELQVSVNGDTAAIGSVVSMVNFYDGATLVGSAPLSNADADTSTANTAALVTGLNVTVPTNTSKLITVKYMLNAIGTGAGTSQSNAAVQLDSVKYADSQGVETTSGTDRVANELYVYKSIPTVTKATAGFSSASEDIESDVYKFTISASSQGAVAVKQIKLALTWSDPGSDSTLSLDAPKLYEDGVDVTSANVSIVDEDGNNLEAAGAAEADGTLVISWDSSLESVIAAGTTKTYTVRGTPNGFAAEADELNSLVITFNGDTSHNGTSTYLNDETDQAAGQSEIWELFTSAAASSSDGTAANFIWSDNSVNTHAGAGNASSTADWANGYKVLNFNLGSEKFETIDL